MYGKSLWKVLSKAGISKDIFNLNYPNQNRYIDIHTCNIYNM